MHLETPDWIILIAFFVISFCIIRKNPRDTNSCLDSPFSNEIVITPVATTAATGERFANRPM